MDWNDNEDIKPLENDQAPTTSRKRIADDITNLPNIPHKEKKNPFSSRFSSISASTCTKEESDFATEVAGRIAAMEIENFMCHGNLQISFDVKNKNCFYIGGSNGSGKSAVFAAFNLGLGGRGSQNDRGNSVKGYIKSGKQRAKIRITLTNRGQGAIKKIGSEEVGETIIVERSINQTSSTYVIKTSGGHGAVCRERVISQKKSDLDLIISRFNIQLTNPIFWMSQDRSRQFLQGWDAHKMFNMFYESTGLSLALNAYEEIENVLKDLKTNQGLASELLKEKKEEFGRILTLRNQVQKVKVLRTNLQCFHWLSCWGPLRDVEQGIKLCESRIKKKEMKKQQMESRIKEILREEKEREADAEKIAAELQKIVESSKSEIDRDKQWENAHRVLKAKLEDINRQEKECKHEEMQHIRNIEKMEHNIRDIQQREGANEKLQQLNVATQALATLAEQENRKAEEKVQIQRHFNALEVKKRTKEQEINEVLGKGRELSAHLKQQENILRESDGRAKNQMFRFGEHTAKILELINRNRNQFEKLPKGPIGMHVNVKDKRWTFAVEEYIRNHLKSYVIDNKRDQNTFRKLLSANRIPIPNTFVVAFSDRSHDVRQSEPSEEYFTILRMIDINDIDIRNTLIDCSGIESVILLESDQEARRLMDGNAPRNAIKAVTATGGTAFAHPYRFYACQRPAQAAILEEKVNYNVRAVRESITNLQHQLQSCAKSRTSVEQEFSQVQQEFRSYSDKLNHLEEDLHSIRSKIQKYQRMIDQFEGEDDQDEVVENLRTSIRSYQELIKEINHKRESLREAKLELDDEKQQIEDMRRDIDRERSIRESETSAIRQQFDAIKNESHQLRMKYFEAEDALKNADNEVQDCFTKKTELESQRTEATTLSKAAADLPVPEGYSNPPDFSCLPESRIIREEVEKLEKEIKSEERIRSEMGNQLPDRSEDAVDDTIFKSYYDEFKSFKKSIRKNKEIANKLGDSLAIRRETFPLLQHVIIQRLQTTFKNLMCYVKFNGEVDVDTKRKRLDIKVSRREGDGKPQPALKDMKGLSGGERSYTTACLIMALWAIMDHPFRCMDEFDVFMDMINRKIIMNLLVEMATVKFPHNQFIFFTPQGIRELDDKDRVQIFTMHKPRPD